MKQAFETNPGDVIIKRRINRITLGLPIKKKSRSLRLMDCLFSDVAVFTGSALVLLLAPLLGLLLVRGLELVGVLEGSKLAVMLTVALLVSLMPLLGSRLLERIRGQLNTHLEAAQRQELVIEPHALTLCCGRRVLMHDITALVGESRASLHLRNGSVVALAPGLSSRLQRWLVGELRPLIRVYSGGSRADIPVPLRALQAQGT